MKNLIYDKKVKNGVVKFVLPVAIGEVTFVDGVMDEFVLEAIEELY